MRRAIPLRFPVLDAILHPLKLVYRDGDAIGGDKRILYEWTAGDIDTPTLDEHRPTRTAQLIINGAG